MSRIARTLPVSSSMYRHFAVITVGITICVALFADGETRATVADEIEQQQTKKQMAEREVNKLGFRRKALGALQVKAQGSGWGGDGGGGEMDSGGSAMLPNDYAVVPAGATLLDPLAMRRGGGTNMPPVLPKGMAAEDYDASKNAVGDYRKRVGAAKRLTTQELDSIAAASRARTGRSEHTEN